MKQLKQKGALERLQAQLKSGVKTVKGTRDQKVTLSEGDKKRISGEILRLENKIKGN